MFCSMQRNWSKNKMTLRTRNCWERLSNIVGLYRYSRASLFLSTNVCFLHFWWTSRTFCLFSHCCQGCQCPAQGPKRHLTAWVIYSYGLIGHFNLSVSMGLHNHNCRHFAKHIWPNGPLRLSFAVAFKAADWPCVLLPKTCFKIQKSGYICLASDNKPKVSVSYKIIASQSQTFYFWIMTGPYLQLIWLILICWFGAKEMCNINISVETVLHFIQD